MQVKDAIKYLNELNPEDEIVIAWWEMEGMFSDPEQITRDEWNAVVHIGDDMDWSMTHESLQEVMEMEIERLRKKE